MKRLDATTWILLTLPLWSCTAPATSEDAPPKTSEAAAPAVEQSVKEGINDNFLAEDLDVDDFTQRFEGESREVFVRRAEIAGAVGLRPGMAIADIGAGTGLFMKAFADAVGTDGLVYAVDISPVFVTHLGERAREEGLPQVETVLCGERSADLPSASVDVAFVCDTYHHFEYPASTLASLFDAIRPGGQLVIVDFERIPGVSREWLLNHVRAGKDVFRAEIEKAGFEFVEEVEVGLEENYFLRFQRPKGA